MEYSQEILEERMLALPEELQIAMVSNDVANNVQTVAKKYSLDIEQSGILADVTSYVMLGLIPSKNFMVELSKRAQIDNAKATEIAKDINSQVFDGIRQSIEKMQDDQDISKDNVLKGIENPSTQTKTPINVLNQTLEPLAPSALVDHLLNAPTTVVNETVEKIETQTKPVTPRPPVRLPSTPDPYREPIE